MGRFSTQSLLAEAWKSSAQQVSVAGRASLPQAFVFSLFSLDGLSLCCLKYWRKRKRVRRLIPLYSAKPELRVYLHLQNSVRRRKKNMTEVGDTVPSAGRPRRQLVSVSNLTQSQRSRSPARPPQDMEQETEAGTARGASGSGEVPGHCDLNKSIDCIVEQEIEKSHFPEVAKHMKKCAQKLASKVFSLQKVKEKIKLQEEAVSMLEQKRMPHGCKPFKASFEHVLLDDMKIREDFQFPSLELPVGISLREAKEKVHMYQLWMQKMLDLELARRQRLDLRASTKLDPFIAECSSLAQSTASNSPWAVLDLEEEMEHPKMFNMDNMKGHAKALYIKTMDIVASKVKQQEDAKLEAQKKEDEVVQHLNEQTPADLFDKAVAQKVESVLKQYSLKGKGKGFGPNLASSMRPPPGLDLGNAMVKRLQGENIAPHDLPKNGLSPVRSGGFGKSKGRGKTRDSVSIGLQKGKAKGYTHYPKGASPKGKQKGKNPTSHAQSAKGAPRGAQQAKGRVPESKGGGKNGRWKKNP